MDGGDDEEGAEQGAQGESLEPAVQYHRRCSSGNSNARAVPAGQAAASARAARASTRPDSVAIPSMAWVPRNSAKAKVPSRWVTFSLPSCPLPGRGRLSPEGPRA